MDLHKEEINKVLKTLQTERNGLSETNKRKKTFIKQPSFSCLF